MKRFAAFLFLLIIMVYSCKHSNVGPVKTKNLCFQTDVLPLYQTHCALSGCHDAITRRLGVELDSYANIMKGIVPNHPDSSHYYTIVALGAMPPPGSGKPKMTPGQIDTISTWINQGATDCTH
jgi:hypothetical protein